MLTPSFSPDPQNCKVVDLGSKGYHFRAFRAKL